MPPVCDMRIMTRSAARRGTARMQCTNSESEEALSRTSSSEAIKLGPDGRLLSDAAKKIEVLASRKRRK
jgi:hypothetical protein